MGLSSERYAVQNPLLRYAREAGWEYLPPEEALRLRKGEAGLVLYEVLVEKLQHLNPGAVDRQKAEEIIRRLLSVPPSIEGNLQAWEFLKVLKTAFIETERRERNVRFLDPENVEANAFHVTDEFTFSNGKNRIRPDVIFLINGLPVLIVETKSAQREEGIALALEQLRRYHQEGPELMALLQLHALTNLIQFYYGTTWNLSRKALFNWRDERAGDFETLVKSFVAPRRILRVLTEYILFTRTDGELSKAVLRPHQMRAVERVLARARDPEKRRGLVWHTQGSGKTYTMITVAQKLLEDPAFRNPTVLMLVDRNELEAQLFANLEAVGIRGVVAQSKAHLKELLEKDHRGLILSTIHKFDDMPANLNTRTNIFVLIDEAHRSTGGDLGNHLMGALPNATYIGFTGTPIDKTAHGQGTFKVFGRDDPKGYLDKYAIRESVQDGTTVPLLYALAPNELRVNSEVLEREFFQLKELEGISDIEELNRILEKAVTLKNMLKSRDRVEKVARFVAQHFRETVEPMGYKAFLVGVDREACALYKEALDKHLPPEYSEVVISQNHNDPPELKRFHLSKEEEERVRKAFRKPGELPKILIVTEKLLTGFDAPVLYCMYLDKPMRDHVLLQAIARVNRPYEDQNGRRKPAGLVVDFVGIFDNLERALAFNSEDVKGTVEGLEVLRERFQTLMEEGRRTYLHLAQGKEGDRAVEAILDHFQDPEARQRFYKYMNELQEAYEILSPDPFLRPFLEDYKKLVGMYLLVRNGYERRAILERHLWEKTASLVQKHTWSTGILGVEPNTPLDERLLEEIANREAPEIVKVLNLVKALRNTIEGQKEGSPYLIPIGERVEEIAKAFEERQLTTKEALEKLRKLVEDYTASREARQRSNLSEEGFTVYWLLHREGFPHAEEVAREVARIFEKYPLWRSSPDQEREVRLAIITALLNAGMELKQANHHKERILRLLKGEG
ncbi:MAG: type I restriction endonuclease subunit R [Thermaceae bacterium]